MAMKDRVTRSAARPRSRADSLHGSVASVPVTINHVTLPRSRTPSSRERSAFRRSPRPRAPSPSTISPRVHRPVHGTAHGFPPILGRIEEAAVMPREHARLLRPDDVQHHGHGGRGCQLYRDGALPSDDRADATRWTGRSRSFPPRPWPTPVESIPGRVSGVPAVQAGQFQTLMLAVALDPTYLIPASPWGRHAGGLFGGFFGRTRPLRAQRLASGTKPASRGSPAGDAHRP